MSGALVDLQDVSLGYNGQAVIDHVSLTIERGGFVALLGPNGAGKTTLLRGILGLLPVLAGRIEYGFDCHAHPPGYVPQRDALDSIFPMTAFDVVLMGTYARLAPVRLIGKERRLRAAACLDQVGLSDLGGRQFWELSGGQKQRVLIARALAVNPLIIFLDEPTAGVDRTAEAAITEVIVRLHRDRGLTVVLVTHNLGALRDAVQAVVWVDEGRATKQAVDALSLSGEPAEVFGVSVGTR
jgi:ABC-type Mn2+/Zn2+ transport system ATPase subunit